MQTKIRGIRGGGSGEEVDVKVSVGGGLHIAQMLPSRTLLTALGGGYIVSTITPAASVAAVPTTASLLFIWNGESAGGKSYIIDRIMAWSFESDSANLSPMTLIGCMNDVGTTAPTAELTAKSLSRTGSYGGNGRFDAGASITDNGWYALAPSMEAKSSNAGTACVVAEVDGRIILPPTSGLGLHVLCGRIQVTVLIGCMFYEVQLDLG